MLESGKLPGPYQQDGHAVFGDTFYERRPGQGDLPCSPRLAEKAQINITPM
jgi:hypothetical protein